MTPKTHPFVVSFKGTGSFPHSLPIAPGGRPLQRQTLDVQVLQVGLARAVILQRPLERGRDRRLGFWKSKTGVNFKKGPF